MVVAQADEVLMQGQKTGDMVSDPVLPAAYLPKKISPTGKRAKLKGQFADVEADVFRRMFKLQETSVDRKSVV